MAPALTLGLQTTPPAKLAHFVLRSRHFETTRDWYRRVLGMRVVFDNGKLVFLTYDDEHQGATG